jgi:hypothetical protein
VCACGWCAFDVDATLAATEQVIAALTSSNGFYGVPAVPFILGYDPLVDAETVLVRRRVESKPNHNSASCVVL